MKKPELLVLLLLVSLAVIVYVNENDLRITDLGIPLLKGTGTVLERNLVDVTIIVPECDCYDAKSLVENLLLYGLNVSAVNEVSAVDAQQLVTDYSLLKLPAIIFSGNVENYNFFSSLSFYGTVEGDSFVFRNPDPPFYDVVSGEVNEAPVIITYVNHSSCEKCYDVTVHKDILENTYNLNVASEVFVNETSGLVAEYNITKLPTIILSPEAGDYSTLMLVWSSAGVVAGDGSLVFTEMSSLGVTWYFDLELGEVMS
jgi:hypothetical protein